MGPNLGTEVGGKRHLRADRGWAGTCFRTARQPVKEDAEQIGPKYAAQGTPRRALCVCAACAESGLGLQAWGTGPGSRGSNTPHPKVKWGTWTAARPQRNKRTQAQPVFPQSQHLPAASRAKPLQMGSPKDRMHSGRGPRAWQVLGTNQAPWHRLPSVSPAGCVMSRKSLQLRVPQFSLL